MSWFYVVTFEVTIQTSVGSEKKKIQFFEEAQEPSKFIPLLSLKMKF